MKLLMLKGLPGSGKSTWAKEFVAKNPGWVRVNKDDLRSMLAIKFSGKNEDKILFYRDLIVELELGAHGRNVIVDDTNFHPKHETKLRAIAKSIEAEFEEKFFDTPLEQCIKNDLKRPNSVGEKVIRQMHNQYLVKHEPKQRWVVGLPKAVIVDIDGTVALHTGRNPYDTTKYHTDTPNKPVVAMVQEFARQGYHIIFTSGRDETFRETTWTWLRTHVTAESDPMFIELLMRPAGDRREDSTVKQELYEEHIKGRCNVFAVLDDRNRVVDMWRRMGLTCLQVADGDF